MNTRFALPALLFGCGLVSLACGPAPPPNALAALTADSPCYRVNLADGVADADEFTDLFDCLDRHEHLGAFRPAVEALGPAGSEDAAAFVSALFAAGLESLVVLDRVLALLDEGAAVSRLFDILYELTAGVGIGQPGDPSSSPLRHLAAPVPRIATAWAAEPVAREALTHQLLGNDLPALIPVLAELVEGPHHAAMAGALPAAAELILLTRSPTNDRLPGATGDSLRDLVTVYVTAEPPALATVAPSLAELLLDEGLVEDAVAWAAEAPLHDLPPALTWLAEVDRSGAPLPDGETSALARMVRVFANTNGPVDCELDLWVTRVEWSFPNLAVRLLQIVSTMEPGTAQSAASLLDSLTGNLIGEAILQAAVDSGTCPTFDQQTLNDLDAVLLLASPEAAPLLDVAGPLLAMVDQTGGLPALADTIEAVARADGVGPLEELVRDLGPADATVQVLDALQAAARPLRNGQRPLATLLGRIGALIHSQDGPSELEHVRPALAPLLNETGLWDAMHATCALAALPNSAIGEAPSLLPDLLATDPQLTVLAQVALLDRPAIMEPLLGMLAREAVTAELLRSDRPGVPLEWLAERIADGSFRDVLLVIREAVDEVGG